MTQYEQRILSVSYGSFSVKLEGFDDPFAIMRRVTEYFRSVTAVDPSFGQKPLVEDLTVLEAMETAIFSDEVTMEKEGSTLTLRPKMEEDETEEQDVFLLDSDSLTTEQALQTPKTPVVPSDISNDQVTAAIEEQIASAAEPLDLSEMAQNHQEMPFVKKEEAPKEEEIAAKPAIKKYRSLSATGLTPAARAEEPIETAAQIETPQETVAAAPFMEIVDDEPAEKRPLRIIRNDYAYEEPVELKKTSEKPSAEGQTVNPFRKFPKREATAPVETAPKVEAPVVEQDDDLVSAFRKLRAEHG